MTRRRRSAGGVDVREERHEHIENGPCEKCNGHAHTAECDIGYVRRHGSNVRISELDLYEASLAGSDTRAS